jgi:hypothetical protein
MRDQIKAMIACGINPTKVAMVFDMTHSELLRSYGKEIATAEAEANATVASSLYHMATSGKHPQASIFWLKSRAGWKDNPEIIVNIDHNTPREEIVNRIKELESLH